jgi:hypothetical protein
LVVGSAAGVEEALAWRRWGRDCRREGGEDAHEGGEVHFWVALVVRLHVHGHKMTYSWRV